MLILQMIHSALTFSQSLYNCPNTEHNVNGNTSPMEYQLVSLNTINYKLSFEINFAEI